MSDWKSRYGVTADGAYNAGVYGTPNSTWDIARAQEETRKLQMSQAGYTVPPISFPPPPAFNQSSIYPAGSQSYIHADSGSSSGCLKVVLVLVLLGVATMTANAWLPPLIGLIDSFVITSPSVSPLATAHYERLSPQAVAIAKQPTSRLYAIYFRGAAPDWNSMSTKQKTAVAAAWIRYTRNPGSFDQLAVKQKIFIFKAFDSYLTALAGQGDANAVKDLERFRK